MNLNCLAIVVVLCALHRHPRTAPSSAHCTVIRAPHRHPRTAPPSPCPPSSSPRKRGPMLSILSHDCTIEAVGSRWIPASAGMTTPARIAWGYAVSLRWVGRKWVPASGGMTECNTGMTECSAGMAEQLARMMEERSPYHYGIVTMFNCSTASQPRHRRAATTRSRRSATA